MGNMVYQMQVQTQHLSYAASRFTVSNTEFDGATTTSATCNGDTYWGTMFVAEGD